MEEIILNYEYYNEKKYINHFDNFLYNDNYDKIGDFDLKDNSLTLNWYSNLKEVFQLSDINNNKDNIFLYKTKNNFDKIRVIHDKWIDDVILKDNECFRKSINLKGNYKYDNNTDQKIIIEWQNSDIEKYIYDKKSKCYSLINLNNFIYHDVKLYNYLNDNIIIEDYVLNKDKILKNKNIKGKFSRNNELLNIHWYDNNKKLYKFYMSNTILVDIKLFNNEKHILNSNDDIYYYFKNIIIKKNNNELYELINDNNNLLIFENNYNDYLFIKNINGKLIFDNDEYIKNINFENYNWSDNIILNFYTKKLYRTSNNNEKGSFIIDNENNKIIVKWDKWDEEIYILEDNKYKLELFFLKEYKFIHKDWEETCKIDKYKIYRPNNQHALINNTDNIIEIKWKDWGNNIFYNINNIYYFEELLDVLLKNIYLNDTKYYLFDKYQFILNNKYKIVGEYGENNDTFILNNNRYYKHLINDKNILYENEYIKINLISYKKSILYLKNNNIFDNKFNIINNCKFVDNNIHYNDETFEIHENFIYYSKDIKNKKSLTIIDKLIVKYNINYINNYIYDEYNNNYNFIKLKDLFYIDFDNNVKSYKLIDSKNNIYICEDIYNNFKKGIDMDYLYYFNSHDNNNDTINKNIDFIENCIYRLINNKINIYSYDTLINYFLFLDSKKNLDLKIKENKNIFDNNIYSINLNNNKDLDIDINENNDLHCYDELFIGDIYDDKDNNFELNFNPILLKKNLFNDKYIKKEFIYDSSDNEISIEDNILIFNKKITKYFNKDLIIYIEINNYKNIDMIIKYIELNFDYNQYIIIFINFEYNIQPIVKKFNNLIIYQNNNNYTLSLYLIRKHIEINKYNDKNILYINKFNEYNNKFNIDDYNHDNSFNIDNYKELNLLEYIHNKFDIIIYLVVWIILNNNIFKKFLINKLIDHSKLNDLLFKFNRYYK